MSSHLLELFFWIYSIKSITIFKTEQKISTIGKYQAAKQGIYVVLSSLGHNNPMFQKKKMQTFFKWG
jgi:hypothetical protein